MANSLSIMDEQKHSNDTRVDGEVKVKKRKKRKKHLFKLSAMNELVDENSFLKNKYDKLSAGAEEKLGYHWNEVVQNILFNKYVKPNETLMGRYLEIKRRDEAEHDKKKHHKGPAPEKPQQQHTQDPPEEMPPVVAPQPSPNDPLDTRITTESTDTFSAGNYQHSGPLTTVKGGMDAWMRNWESKIKKDKSGMTIIRENKMATNPFKELTESGNPLSNPALLDILFEGLDSKPTTQLNEAQGEAKPAALVQLDRLHKETEKASNGYYKKEQKERNLNMVETKDGGAEQKHDFDKDSVKPEDVKKHHPSKEEQEYVKLNRGGNLADRAIQGIKDMPSDFKDRMKDEAGVDVVKDAEDKAKEIEKVKPALAPPARIQTIKEGVVISARYMTPVSRKIVSFNTSKAEKIEALNENFIPLETKGFGNDANPEAKMTIENHDFFIDLAKDQIYMLEKKANTLNESVVSIQKSEYDRMRKLITYSPSKWLGTK